MFQNLKFKLKLWAFNQVLAKVDVERIAKEMEFFGERTFARGKKDYMLSSYYKLLELVSAINRRLKSL
jgi:hypothetical protein